MSKKPLLNESTVRQFMKFANLGGLADKFVNEAYMQEDEDEQKERPEKSANEGHEEGHMAEEEQVDEVAPIVATGLKLGAQALKNPAVRKAGAAALKGAVGSMMGGDDKNEGYHMEEDAEMEEGHEEGHMEEGDHDKKNMDEDYMGEGDHDDEDADPVTDMDAELTDRLEQAAQKAAQALLDALGVEGEVSLDGADADMDDMGDEPMGDEPMGDMDEPMGDMGMDDDEGEVLDEVDLLDEEEIVNETMTRVMKRLQAMNESKKAESKKNEIVDSVADAIIARLRAKK